MGHAQRCVLQQEGGWAEAWAPFLFTFVRAKCLGIPCAKKYKEYLMFLAESSEMVQTSNKHDYVCTESNFLSFQG